MHPCLAKHRQVLFITEVCDCIPFPSRFLFTFFLDWIKLKLDESLGRDEFTHDSQKCLSFISYASTYYLSNLHNRITKSLSIDPHDIMKCETCSFSFKVLEIYFKRLKWGNSHALSTLQKSYPEPYMSRVEPTYLSFYILSLIKHRFLSILWSSTTHIHQ